MEAVGVIEELQLAGELVLWRSCECPFPLACPFGALKVPDDL